MRFAVHRVNLIELSVLAEGILARASCMHNDCVEPAALRRYDRLRWLVFGVLLALLLVLLLVRGYQQWSERFALSRYQLESVTVADSPGLIAGLIKIVGSGRPAARVEIECEGMPVGTTRVNAEGRWAVAQPIELPPGPHRFKSRLRDEAGNLMGKEQSFELAFPELPAPKLSVDAVQAGDFKLGDGAGRVVGMLTLSGSGHPSATVDIHSQTEPIARSSVGEDGHWAVTQLIELAPGHHHLRARMLGKNGGTFDESEPFEVVFPEITISKFTIKPPELDNFSLGGAAGMVYGELKLKGTGHPHVKVELIQQQEPIATTEVGSDGNWALNQPIELPPGRHQLQVRMVGMGGGVLSEPKPLGLVFPEVEVNPLIVASPRFEILQTADTPSKVQGKLRLLGRGESGLLISLLLDDEFLGETQVQPDGHWTFDKGLSLSKGSHSLTAHMLAKNQGVIDEKITTLGVSMSSGEGKQTSSGPGTDRSSNEGSRQVSDRSSLEVILDASGSMWAKFGEKHRFEMARDLMFHLINNVLPEGTPMALRAFGNREGHYSCRNDLVAPLQALERRTMSAAISRIVPKYLAGSSIADSLLHTKQDLSGPDGSKIILLITDGNETCDGDPVQAIRDLVKHNDNVQVYIVGVAIQSAALKAEYQRWAELGRGKYYNSEDVQGLVTLLASAFERQ